MSQVQDGAAECLEKVPAEALRLDPIAVFETKRAKDWKKARAMATLYWTSQEVFEGSTIETLKEDT